MIVFDQVGKRYRSWQGREVRALEDFSLEIAPGEVFGLAGPNGAGKSTLISLLLGFLGPSTGMLQIDGLAPRRYVERHGVSYLSELVNIPPAWRVTSALRRYAILAGLPSHEVHARVESMLETLGLEEHRSKRVRQLSKGNLQRLGLAQALLGEERVIVLDEPTHGLDPVWTQRFRDVVDQLRRPDRVILIASHNLDELARLADRVAIIDRGRLQRVVDVRANERTVTEGAPYRIVVASSDTRVGDVFPGAREVASGEFEVRALSLADINAGLVRLMQSGALVRAVYPVHSPLEQQFREAVGVQVSAGREESR
ncbi:MAG: ABC transporter ATP-binding protein [Gemmatimonadaceae bacterium]|nr:ABC transporter ATP-binding protein [Gemmatimonadaceae bacterium]